MKFRATFKHTLAASYIGYITQGIVNNFAPLLFLTFATTWDIPLSKITLLITINFGTQLLVDILSTGIVDKIGYRRLIVAAHLLSAIGLVGLGLLPQILPDPYIGLVVSIVLYATGGGLIEVLISPIAEACPTTNKEAHMSLLHSFYCWGYMLVILGSTAFFVLAGIENWWVLACLWALVPLVGAAFFLVVPIRQLEDDLETGEVLSLPGLFRTPLFWLFILMMFCAGAAELAMSQWASAFAEAGLGISKTMGDLLGPCLFALLMGLSRLFSSRMSRHIRTETFMGLCCGLCLVGYLLAALAPWPLLSLVGCGVCGFSVGIFWPGTYSLAAVSLRRGGSALFAFLALAGDLGCVGGPALVSLGTRILPGGSLKIAMLPAVIFPILLFIGVQVLSRRRRRGSAAVHPSKP